MPNKQHLNTSIFFMLFYDLKVSNLNKQPHYVPIYI